MWLLVTSFREEPKTERLSHGCGVRGDAAEADRCQRALGTQKGWGVVPSQITGLRHSQGITRGAVAQTGNTRQGGQFRPASST